MLIKLAQNDHYIFIIIIIKKPKTTSHLPNLILIIVLLWIEFELHKEGKKKRVAFFSFEIEHSLFNI